MRNTDHENISPVRIRGVFVSRGDTDVDEVGGLDRIAIGPSFPYLQIVK